MTPTTTTSQCPFTRIPPEIFDNIVEYLVDPNDLCLFECALRYDEATSTLGLDKRVRWCFEKTATGPSRSVITLFKAVIDGHAALVERMLTQYNVPVDSTLDQVNNDERKELMRCRRGYLRGHGIAPEITPLFIAVSDIAMQINPCLDVLLRHDNIERAEWRETDHMGTVDELTVLQVACSTGNTALVDFLFDRGADRKKRTPLNKYTCLHLAAARRDVIDLFTGPELGALQVIKLLIDKGADLSAVDKDGTTPLWRALIEGMDQTAELLMAYGASLKNALQSYFEEDARILTKDQFLECVERAFSIESKLQMGDWV